MLQREVDATLWAMDDVRKLRPKLPLAVLVIPPGTTNSTFTHAARMFRDLNVEVVPDDRATSWAKKVIKKVTLPSLEHLAEAAR